MTPNSAIPRDAGADGVARSADRYGLRLVMALRGAWRPEPARSEMSATGLEELVEGLARSRTAPLAWRKVRGSPLATTPAGRRLRQHYHLHGMEAALHERDLARVLAALRDRGVEPVLVKGPAIARAYPEPGLRPYDDLDFCIRPDQYEASVALVRSWSGWAGRLTPIDLHRGFERLDSRGWDDLLARSWMMTVGDTEVRVLGSEDHLRLLCLHLLRHGVLSPLALCDVAVAVETRPPGFDWDRSLGGDRRRADWMACTIGLAHQFLGVEVADTPVAARAGRLPPWLGPSVLSGWEAYYAADPSAGERPASRWSGLGRRVRAVTRYWPSPVMATVHLARPFTDLPRAPIQTVDALGRLVRFGLRSLTGRHPGPTSHH